MIIELPVIIHNTLKELKLALLYVELTINRTLNQVSTNGKNRTLLYF